MQTMLFTVDPTSAVGLADQVASQVRGALAEGRVVAGDRLPPAREVAAGLGINMHTVLRAYAALRDEGLVDLRRGRGAVVRADPDALALRRTALTARLRELVAEAAELGLDRDRLIEQIRSLPS